MLKENKSTSEIEFATGFFSKIDSLKLILENNPESYNEMFYKMATYMKIEFHPANELFIKTGDKADKFFIILRGKVSCFVPKELKISISEEEYTNYLKVLHEYGEETLIYKCELANANILLLKKPKRGIFII